MTGRLAAQLLGLLAALILASALVYVLTVSLPGDPARAVFRAQYGPDANPDPAVLQAIREEAGFDQPLPLQYLHWLTDAVRGDFGRSYTTQQPAGALVLDRLGVTLVLSFGGLGIALALSLPAAAAAVRWRRAHGATVALTQSLYTVPDYLLAVLGVLVFAVVLGWLPVAGWGEPQAAVIPLLVVAVGPWALFTRLTITGLEEGLRSDWAQTARAKGLSDAAVIRRHAMPHAVIPVVNILGLSLGSALSSTLIVEVIFAIPGAGRLLFDGIAARDLPVVQAGLMVQVTLAVVANRVADIAVLWLDPVLRSSERTR